MKRCLAVLIVLALAAISPADEPAQTDGTLLLWNFDSLSEPNFVDGNATVQPYGATLGEGKWGQGLHVGPEQYVTIDFDDKTTPEQGTVMFWFRPNWSTADTTASHALVSWGWDDGKGGYGVLSHGWWEPDGAGRTYLVFENQLYAHTSDALSYTQGEWMHFGIVWEHVNKAIGASLYLNGYLVGAVRSHPCDAVPPLKTPVFLGSDGGTSLTKGRWADGIFDGLHILNRALSAEEMRDAFRAQESEWQAYEAKRNAWLWEVLKQPYTPQRDAQGRILESRALLDEWCRWATREGAEEAVQRMADAGFNVYIPCVWHGRGAWWPSKLTPMEPRVETLVKEQGDGFDPLANLIRLCHEKGIEVHPWFCVCYGDEKWEPLKPFIEEGTPKGACEAHNPKFRKFIVDLMMEVVRNYDVDGLNLDYIRTKGLSTSETAKAAYRQRFGAELLEDVKKKPPNGWPNPNIVKFQDEAIADIVRTVSTQARAAKPRIVISSDGHPYLPTESPGTQGRNDFWWAQEGWVDVIYAMDYGRRLRSEKGDAIRQALKHPSAFAVIAGNYEREKTGKVVSRDGQLVADLISFCQRKYPGNGVALYWYGSLDDAQTKALRAGPFKDPAVPHWLRAAGGQ